MKYAPIWQKINAGLKTLNTPSGTAWQTDTSSARLQRFFLISASFALMLGFALRGIWGGVWVGFTLGIIGWLRPHPTRPYLGSGLFAGFLLTAIYGALFDISSVLLLAVSLSALAYWDLEVFQSKLEIVAPSQVTRKLEQAHRLRLFCVLGIALGIGLAGSFVRLRLSIGLAMLLSLVAILSIRFGVRALQEQPSEGS